MIKKSAKLALFPIILGFIVVKFQIIPSSFVLPALVILSVVGGRVVYTLDKKK